MISSIIVESVNATGIQPTDNTNLIGHWSFNEGEDNSCSGGQDACSSLIYGNHLIFVGAPSWSTSTPTTETSNTTSLQLDGSSDYAYVADPVSPAILDFTTSSDFTISGWFNRSTSSSDDTIIAKRDGQTAGDVGYIIYIDGTSHKLVFEVSDGTDEYLMESVTTFTVAAWKHFAIVWDDDDVTNTKMYISGVDDNATKTGTIGDIDDISNSLNFTIGAETDGGELFSGKIDDVRLYNKKLLANEVSMLANTNLSDGTVSSFQKISDTAGGFTETLDDSDRIGCGVSNIGDLNGDGITDLAIGAYTDDDGGTDRGAVYILFMNADGTVSSSQKISDTAGGFTATLDNSDLFGFSVDAIGDLDGDGITEIAVGAFYDDDGGGSAGAVHILFMNSDGTVSSTQKISNTAGNFTGTLDVLDSFGYSLNGIGDLNGDGINDLAVGAYTDDDGGTNRGSIYVLFLNSDGTVSSTQKISDTEGNFTEILDDSDTFGSSISTIGDINGDGVQDLVVGAQSDDDGGANRGAVYVLFMNNDGTVTSSQKISDTAGGFTASFYGTDFFGRSSANLGDINNDGITDLAVSAYLHDDGGPDRGSLFILFMNSDGTVSSYQEISDTEGNFLASLSNSDYLGYNVANLGDLDGDGVIDLAVGATGDNDGGTDRGAVYILFLDDYSISGTVYSDEGSTAVTSNANATVSVYVNGVLAGTDSNGTDGSGQWEVSGLSYESGDIITAFLDGASIPDNAVTVANASSTLSDITGFDLYYDYLIIKSEEDTAVTNDDLYVGAGSASPDLDISAVYTVSSASTGVLTVTSSAELLIWTGDTFTPGGDLDLGGNLDINGTFILVSETSTIAGNFDNAGTFNAGSSTVILSSESNDHSIIGSNTFYNLTVSEDDDTDDGVLTFTTGATTTINGTLTLDGYDASDRINLISTVSDTEAYVDFQGTASFSGDYLDVKDVHAVDNSSNISLPINPASSVSSGNDTGWVSLALSYSTDTFTEVTANDGSMSNNITITLDGDTFSAGVVSSNYVTASNVPPGLTASFTRSSDSQISFSLIGNAANHLVANDASNLTVSFTDDSFTLYNSSTISNTVKSDLAITFSNQAYLTYNTSTFREDLDDDGTIDSYAVLSDETAAIARNFANRTGTLNILYFGNSRVAGNTAFAMDGLQVDTQNYGNLIGTSYINPYTASDPNGSILFSGGVVNCDALALEPNKDDLLYNSSGYEGCLLESTKYFDLGPVYGGAIEDSDDLTFTVIYQVNPGGGQFEIVPLTWDAPANTSTIDTSLAVQTVDVASSSSSTAYTTYTIPGSPTNTLYRGVRVRHKEGTSTSTYIYYAHVKSSASVGYNIGRIAYGGQGYVNQMRTSTGTTPRCPRDDYITHLESFDPDVIILQYANNQNDVTYGEGVRELIDRIEESKGDDPFLIIIQHDSYTPFTGSAYNLYYSNIYNTILHDDIRNTLFIDPNSYLPDDWPVQGCNDSCDQNKLDKYFRPGDTVHENATGSLAVWEAVFESFQATVDELPEDSGIDDSVLRNPTVTLSGDNFVSNLAVDTHVQFGNVPAGLTATINRTSSTTVDITLTGTSTSHADADDISNLTITWLDGAFSSTASSSNVTNYSLASFIVDYIEEEEVEEEVEDEEEVLNYTNVLVGNGSPANESSEDDSNVSSQISIIETNSLINNDSSGVIEEDTVIVAKPTKPTYQFTSYLYLGNFGEEVKQLQLKLKELGYFTYPIATGYFGPITKEAVTNYQKSQKFTSTPGWVGPQTRESLNKCCQVVVDKKVDDLVITNVNYIFKNYLYLGSQGEEVKQLQLKLKELGYFNYKKATGYFGSITKQAVIDFQKAMSFSFTPGWVGPQTREMLNK